MCQKIMEDVRTRQTHMDKQSYMRYKMPHIISPNRYVKDTRPWDSEFETTDSCISCGLCSKVCPVDNIVMIHDKPNFNHNCQRCMACIQYCPKSAFVIEGKAMNKRRYVYPEVSVAELLEFGEK